MSNWCFQTVNYLQFYDNGWCLLEMTLNFAVYISVRSFHFHSSKTTSICNFFIFIMSGSLWVILKGKFLSKSIHLTSDNVNFLYNVKFLCNVQRLRWGFHIYCMHSFMAMSRWKFKSCLWDHSYFISYTGINSPNLFWISGQKLHRERNW